MSSEETALLDTKGKERSLSSSGVGFFSRLMFSWIEPAMDASKRKVLEREDLIELEHGETSNGNKLTYTGKLMRNLMVQYKWSMLTGISLGILAGFLDSTVPLYILYIENFLESDRSWQEGVASVFVFVSISLFKSFIWSKLMWLARKMVIRMTAGISNLLFAKTLTITSDISKGQAVNLLQVDGARIAENIPFYGYGCSSDLMNLVVGMCILVSISGIVSLIGVGVMMFLLLLNFLLSKCVNRYNDRMMRHKDERMKHTAELFTHIKMFKIYAWEDALLKRVLDTRAQEVNNLGKYIYTYCLLIFSLWCSPIVAAFAIFASYTFWLGHEIDTSMAFSTLSVLFLLQAPLREVPIYISSLLQAYTSSKRIDEFLCHDNIQREGFTSVEGGKVTFEGASFAYPQHSDPILKNIDLSIRPGEFVAIVGKVGSGKSSMINAILGEMTMTSGTLSIGGRLAYTAALESWIQNATIKDNILFGKTLDPDKYQRTLQVCALISDLESLPGGDLTEIGEKGINLSGGQRARISLARAVYQDCDIYLLDDPLSSMDACVGSEIFHRCLLDGLKDKTRILITHSTAFLNLIDRVVVMDAGTIVEANPYSELHTDFQCTSVDSSADYSNSSDKPYESKEAAELVISEDREVGKVTWNVYLIYFRYAGGFIVFFVVCLVMALWMASRFVSDYTLKSWSEDGGDHSNTHFFLPYVFLGTIACLFILVCMLVVAAACVRASRWIHEAMLRRLVRAPINLFFDVTSMGQILNRLSRDTSDIDCYLTINLGGTVIQAFAIVCAIGATVFFMYWIVPLIPFMLWGLLKLQMAYLSVSRETTRMTRIYKTPILNHFSESLSGMKTVRCFKKENEFKKKNSTLVDAHNQVLFSNYGSDIWLYMRLELIVITYITVAVSAMLYARESVSPSAAAMMLTYMLPLSDMIILIRSFACIENSMVCVERADAMSRVIQEAETDLPEDEGLVDWPTKGSIEFKEICLKYRPTAQVVISKLSASIRGKERVGIAGRTGSGKSSLALALFRIVELQRGHIFIDGVDTRQVGLHTLRRAMTMIPQDPVLFKGSLRYNLDPCGLYSHDEVKNALKDVDLDFELEEEVVEGGTNFSVGERQLICIARAGLARPKILVLDEATSAIDFKTDSFIQQYLRTKFDCTMLTIAHRLHTILDSDRVMVLDQGRLAEFDSPQILLADESSAFFQLAKSLGYESKESS